MRRLLIAFACVGLLSACSDSTQSLRELRYAVPNTDPYQAALATGYQQLAEQKLAAYAWDDSEKFADKGLLAAYGRDLQPEDPTQWALSAEDLTAFTQARTQLIEAVAATKTTQPNQAAAAMIRYDRWLAAAVSDPESELTLAAHEDFSKSLGTLQVAQAPEPGTIALTSEPEPLAASVAMVPAEPTAPATLAKPKLDITVLYFPFDSDSLGASAKKAVAAVASKIHAAAATAQITINGHTDRAGSETYNVNLSERRAQYVQKELVKAGIDEKRTQTYGFGESDPAVPTADDVREAKNRRVEIVVE